MNKNLIHFENMDWERPKEGVEQKICADGNQRLRLLKFRDSFVEEEWCLSGHIGFVLEGQMDISFNGVITSYKKGDGLWINEGESSKHKVIIEKGKQIELILFESMKHPKNRSKNLWYP